MTDRATARIVGVLFIVATAAAIIGGSLVLVIEEPGALTAAADHEMQVVTGVVLELVLVLSVIGIAALLFPVLRRHDEGLALGYLGVRTLEGVLLLAAAIGALVFVGLGGSQGGGVGAQRSADLLLVTREWAYLVGSMVMLGVGALVLYGLLYRSRLVPTWLSVWGLIGGALILARGLAEMYGVEFALVAQAVLAAPIALNEMVLAVWLIVRGFAAPDPATARGRRQRPAVGP